MAKMSRRSLARWAAVQLADGKSTKDVADHLAAAMQESGLSGQVAFLVGDIIWELERRKVLAVGKVTSAHELSNKLEVEISSQIKKITGVKEVSLEKTVDKSVLGGVRVETSGYVWDRTARRQLSSLKEVYK